MRQQTLTTLINTGTHMNDAQKQSLYNTLKEGCRGANRDRLHRKIFNVPPSRWAGYSLFDRLFLEGDTFQYFAVQSYPDEIKEVIKKILN
jgi:hypothetical protein